ncbi:MAG: sulfatase [Verrucomicrobia bacterium]|nr:sulfatase [Verrucomicrobiota bacterium]
MKMKKISGGLASLMAAGMVVAASAATPPKPNFVILFIDDMGWRDWSGNGSDYLVTPNIDKIGEEGLVFDQGYVNAANCAPSRCALLSGQYPPRNDFYNVWTIHRGNKKTDRLSLADVQDGQTLRKERITFGEALQKAGYKTAMYGKWHVAGPEKIMPDVQGFDDVSEHDAKKLGKLFKQDGDPKQIFAYTRHAMDFAEACHRENKPFLIYLAHHAVHGPDICRPESKEIYANKKPGKINKSPKYGGMMHDTDAGIGMLMKKLKELGIDDNTVVFFLSDNGGTPSHCTQPPLRAYKGSFYEGGIRVPFIVRWPGKIKPGKSHVPVMAIDLYPTMLELAGVTDIPAHVDGQPLDGTSIVPLLKGGSIEERPMFWHFPAYLAGNPKYEGARNPKYRQRPVSVIRKGDWKLLLHFEEWSLDGGRAKIAENKSVELYNLKDDPGELNDLSLKNTAKRDELLDELITWWETVGAPVPAEPNPKRNA